METDEKQKLSQKTVKKAIVNFYDCFLRVCAYNISNKIEGNGRGTKYIIK